MYDKNPPENGGFVSNLSVTLNKGHALFALVNETPYPGMPG